MDVVAEAVSTGCKQSACLSVCDPGAPPASNVCPGAVRQHCVAEHTCECSSSLCGGAAGWLVALLLVAGLLRQTAALLA